MKLYEIRSQYLDCLNRIENGEIDEEFIKDTLESLDGDFDEKVNGIACFIKGLEGDITALKSEVDNLRQRADNKAKKADRLRQYIFESMKAVSRVKVETAQNVISVKKNPPRVDIGDGFIQWAKDNSFDDILCKHVEEYRPDKAAIKEELKKGNEIPYCRLIQGESLSIK
ncbi:MAG TPA: siphovirus Gp157 family protein [Ruminiclostridium sp.]